MASVAQPIAVARASPGHPGVAAELLPLRDILRAIDESGLQNSEFYQLALATVEAIAGDRHPLAGHLHIQLAQYHYARGNDDTALRHALQGEEILLEGLRLSLTSLPEIEVRRMVSSRESALDLILALAAGTSDGETRLRCWDAFIRGRTVVLDEMAARHHAVSSSSDTVLARLVSALSDARARLAALSFVEPAGDGSTARAISRARMRRDSLERTIARLSDRFRDDVGWRDAGFSEVRRQLAPDEVLVAYGYYRPPARQGARVRSASYRFLDRLNPELRAGVVAFVLRGGESWPVAVPLGPARRIDVAVEHWRKLAGGVAGAAYPDTVPSSNHVAGDSLRRLIWDPVVPHIGSPSRIFVVFDGALLRVALDPLPADSMGRRYLAEQLPTIQYLDSERDLVRRAVLGQGRCSLLAVGGVEFAGRPAPSLRSASSCTTGATSLAALRASGREVEVVLGRWGSLDRARCGADALVGVHATEGRLKALAPGRQALHLATHGFFLECAGGIESGGRSRFLPTRYLSPPAAARDELMLRTGLVLEPDSTSVGQDGILTAEEVASLDLSGARLVVLSACESGLGVLRSGEGMFGLRRALAVSGAGSQVLSLWPVGDSESAIIMDLFYGELRSGDLDGAGAMRRVSLEILRRLRLAGIAPSPNVWSPYVSVGPGSRPAFR